MENVVENYLEMINFISEGETIIEEGFSDIVKKLDPKKIKSLIPGMKKAYQEKDVNKLHKITKTIPSAKLPLDKIEKLASKSVPKFNDSFSLAKKVLSNTFPTANEKLIKAISIGIATKAGKDKNPTSETKKSLKKFAFGVNKETDELEKKNEEKGIKIPRTTLIDEVIGWTWVAFWTSLLGGVALYAQAPILGLVLIFVFWYIANWLANRDDDPRGGGITDFRSNR
jgi:hypothetical protein